MPDLHRRSSGAFCLPSDVMTSYPIDRSTRRLAAPRITVNYDKRPVTEWGEA
jgi:hypothetical protein